MLTLFLKIINKLLKGLFSLKYLVNTTGDISFKIEDIFYNREEKIALDNLINKFKFNLFPEKQKIPIKICFSFSSLLFKNCR